jgi:leukotriene B4 12-hydroxydehydrogenase/15-oxo-prostaglandin 13-reductase
MTLAARPAGWPSESDFGLEERPMPTPGEGEVLVQGLYLSVDPYMRGRMREGASYADPVELGDVMTGGVVGRVVESKSPKFQKGDIAVGVLGWQEYAVAPGEQLQKFDASLAPVSTALGVLGMPGLTAYFGLLDLCEPKAGETLLVNGAAGAVGSLVGQIGKIRGCRVVGVAGSDEKVRHVVEDLGFDAAFNYKTAGKFSEKYRELCPGGIDCYFDNVGGPLTDAVWPRLNIGARVAICGQISQYNNEQAEMEPRWLFHLIVKRARVQGFLVFDYAPRYKEGLKQLGEWVREGKLQYRETVTEGLENAPAAFIGMMKGGNIGKQLVKLAD